MVLLKLFSTSKKKEKEVELQYIIKGYPTTDAPIVPDIMKYAVEWKPIETSYGKPILGFTMAHVGADLVSKKSLNMMSELLDTWYKSFPEIREELTPSLLTNVIAISYSLDNFLIGESCQEFKLKDKIEQPADAYFTYRKLSECVQCTYYNENGVEHLAGVCFYPAPHGKPKFLKINEELVWTAISSCTPYPLKDRREGYNFQNSGKYERFCGEVGRKVIVTIGLNDGFPRHFDLDHKQKLGIKTLCKECAEDFFTYKWEEPKKDSTKSLQFTEVSSTDAPEASELSGTSSSQSGSTENLLEDFEQVQIPTDVDSEFDAELV